MDVTTLHARTVEEFVSRVRAVGATDWDRPTPCSDWTVRELVNHVVGEDRWTVPLLAGRTIAEVGDAYDGDLLGADPLGAAEVAGDAAVSAVAEAVPTAMKVHLSYGDEDVGEYVGQLATDHLIHAWDLAAATGGATRLDPELVGAVAEWFAEREQLYRGAGLIADRVEVAGDDPQDRLLAATGRAPDWHPPS
jgi:uncharacterized protein (TIGR03086 family)